MPQSDALPPRHVTILTSTGGRRAPSPRGPHRPGTPNPGGMDPRMVRAYLNVQRQAARLADLEAEHRGRIPPAAPAPVSEPSAARALVARAKATFRRLNQYRP